MASLVVLVLVTIVVGACLGAFLKLSFAIRRDDRARWALRFDAPNRSAQTARALVISSSRWDY
jgi:hypothetical protein